MKRAIVAVLLTAACHSMAHAATLSNSVNFSFTTPSSGQNFTLPTFDDLGGALLLNSVTLNITGAFDAHLALMNTGGATETAGVQASGNYLGLVPPHLAAIDTFSQQTPLFNVAPGTLDLDVLSFPVSRTGFIFAPEAYDYANAGYFGSGNLDLSVTANPFFGVYGGPPMGGNTHLLFLGPQSFSGTATITFDYTVVPEPHGIILALAAAVSGAGLLRFSARR